MKVELLVSEWCASCHAAEKIWRQVSEERDFDFAVVDMGQPEGKALVSRLRLKTIPALIVDGALVAIGVQPLEEARRIVAAAPPKQTGATRHVGLAMALTGRVAVHSSMIYLVLAGAVLPWHGSLFLPGYARPAALHVFTLGFITFLIYALGEHMLPRFTGNPIRLGAVAWAQLAIAHVGLWLFAAGFLLHSLALTGIGGALAWTALLVFAMRLWPVLWPRKRDAARPVIAVRRISSERLTLAVSGVQDDEGEQQYEYRRRERHAVDCGFRSETDRDIARERDERDRDRVRHGQHAAHEVVQRRRERDDVGQEQQAVVEVQRLARPRAADVFADRAENGERDEEESDAQERRSRRAFRAIGYVDLRHFRHRSSRFWFLSKLAKVGRQGKRKPRRSSGAE